MPSQDNSSITQILEDEQVISTIESQVLRWDQSIQMAFQDTRRRRFELLYRLPRGKDSVSLEEIEAELEKMRTVMAWLEQKERAIVAGEIQRREKEAKQRIRAVWLG
jgi:hypothetical protein